MVFSITIKGRIPNERLFYNQGVGSSSESLKIRETIFKDSKYSRKAEAEAKTSFPLTLPYPL